MGGISSILIPGIYRWISNGILPFRNLLHRILLNIQPGSLFPKYSYQTYTIDFKLKNGEYSEWWPDDNKSIHQNDYQQ